MKTLVSILTDEYFLMFLAIGTGLLLGKVKIKSFSLGISGCIFSGIAIGYFATQWANQVGDGEIGAAAAKRILTAGVVENRFFMYFLLLFLVAIGLKVGGSIGYILKTYGIKFVFIGVAVPALSLLVACVSHIAVLQSNPSITPFETVGMFAGSMTSTPGYGAALDVAGRLDYAQIYEDATDEEKNAFLLEIDETGALTAENTPALTEELVQKYRDRASTGISLGYTIGFPIGVLVIVLMLPLLPKMFKIDIEEEKRKYARELEASGNADAGAKEGPLNWGVVALVTVVGIALGNITIPLGSFGSFSLGGIGGVLIAALVLSYIGKIGPVNFRMDSKSLDTIHVMGLTFFMAVVGLRYGYAVINSIMGSGLALALAAVAVEGISVFIVFLIGHKLFKMNWIVLSGAIAGGCTSAPGLGAAIASTNSEDPTAAYGAASTFAILANVLLATLYFSIMI